MARLRTAGMCEEVIFTKRFSMRVGSKMIPHKVLGAVLTLSLLAVGSFPLARRIAQENATPASIRPKTTAYLPPTRDTYQKLAAEVEATLRRDVLDVWFPRAVDNENGGFHPDFTRDWAPGAKSGGKFSVFQGRMTWISAQVAMRRPDLKDKFLPFAQHGLRYLNDTLWDKQYGGFYWGLDDHGNVSPYYT